MARESVGAIRRRSEAIAMPWQRLPAIPARATLDCLNREAGAPNFRAIRNAPACCKGEAPIFRAGSPWAHADTRSRKR